MTMDEKFNQIYQTIVNKNADALELARREAQSENRHNMAILTIIIIINIALDYGLYKLTTEVDKLVVVFMCISLIICCKIMRKDKREKYTTEFKTKIVGTMIKLFEEKLEYIPQIGLSSIVYGEAEFKRYERYHSEDLIQGTLKNGCKFSMSEVLTERKQSDGNGNAIYVPMFIGLFGKVETPKPFNTVLYLRKDKIDKNILTKTFACNSLSDQPRIQLDSPEFEEIFDVYGSDPIIAMQLLTADIMQDLIQFHNDMEMDYELTIKENCMYIRFWCGGMFETAKLKKFSLDRDTLYKYYRMLDFTFSITNKMTKLLNETQYD